MTFSLEALPAKHGDSLLLHFGKKDDPRLIVIDGGPSGVYKAALAPRLEQLRAERGGTLEIEILMVSHLDDDHVRGVLDFSQSLLDDEERAAAYRVATIWQNAFEDVVGEPVEPVVAEAAPAAARPAELDAVVASVGQGRRLRDNARALRWQENDPFDGFVTAPNDAGVEVDLDPLKLTVVGPREKELDDLRKEWEEQTAKMKKADEKETAKIAAYLDGSVFNLSSIACLAEVGKRRMLLTGDARGDTLLLGLEAADLLPSGDGEMKVDLLKVPHHGSSRNVEQKFFERIRARHLLISADGRHGNPDLETLEMISKARPDDDFTLHLTYAEFDGEVGPQIEKFFASEKKEKRKYEVRFRQADEPSLTIDLS